jgi:hypothetical protein
VDIIGKEFSYMSLELVPDSVKPYHDTVTAHHDLKCNAMRTEKYTSAMSLRKLFRKEYIYHEGMVSNAARCAQPNTSKLPITKPIVIGAQNTT